jgi:predicted alpha/beta-hydrolase family hydrolase
VATTRRPAPRVLLFPGAGTSADHPSLVAIDRALAAVPPRGVACRRADFPYRRAGRRAPDRAPVLMQAVRDELASLGPGPVVMGGRSMGGRMCSMVAGGADGLTAPEQLIGLVLVCYPLHPPGKPDSLRVEHLPAITVPCLFVSGTKDPFGSPAELERWSATIPAEVTHEWIDGKGHDLRGADERVAELVAAWVRSRTAAAT